MLFISLSNFDTYGQGEQNMRSKFDVGWVRAVR